MAFRYKLFSIVSLVTLAADQITKYWARAELTLGRPVQVIENYFDWRLSYNKGSAFGLFNSLEWARVFLSVVGVVACIVIFVLLKRSMKDDYKWSVTALALVAGGALGNVIDRILFGKVTDFVVWKVKTTEWPAFNVADAALVAGVLILFLDIGKEQKRAKQEKAAAGRG